MSKDYILVMDPRCGAYLEHRSHKYIKRERKNGKWRYWYDTKITGKEYLRKAEANYRGYQQTMNPNSLTSRPTGYMTLKGGMKIAKNNSKGFYASREAAWERAYRNKSLAGRLSTFVSDGKNLVERLLNKLKKR